MRKELVDLFRDRRTVMLGLFMTPLLLPALLLGMGSLAEKRAKTQLESKLELPVLHAERAPNLIAYLETHNIEILPAPGDVEAVIRDQSRDVVLSIGEDFAEQWRASEAADIEIIHDSTRRDAQIPVRRVEAALKSYSNTVGKLRLLSRGIDPSLDDAVRINHTDLATPEAQKGQILAALLPYLLILSGFLGGAYLVIDATAGERERQSLEPLLATPALRGALMSGKIAAACAFGMLSLLLILLAFKISFPFASGAMKGIDVSWAVIAQLLLILTPLVLLGTTLLTLISATAKSVKEAQSYMGVLMLLPMIPTIVLMVNPLKDKLWMFAVPLLSQNQMILRTVRAETSTALEWATYLGASFGLGALLWLIAARLYHREKLAISG
jgi:sodium transport system permease protein